MITRKLADGSRWPVPCEELSELAHRLRYRERDYYAASVVEAYAHLLALSSRDRADKVRMIRAAATPPTPEERER